MQSITDKQHEDAAMNTAKGTIKKLISSWDRLRNDRFPQFAVDTVRNVCTFLIIAAAALALHVPVVVLSAWKMPAFVTLTLTGCEYGLLVVDVIWLLGDTCIHAFKALRASWKEA
jgi:hypothetical protein